MDASAPHGSPHRLNVHLPQRLVVAAGLGCGLGSRGEPRLPNVLERELGLGFGDPGAVRLPYFDARAELERGIFIVEGLGHGGAVFFPADLPPLTGAPPFIRDPLLAGVLVRVRARPEVANVCHGIDFFLV